MNRETVEILSETLHAAEPAHRLVGADAFEEQGKPDAAELVRKEVDLLLRTSRGTICGILALRHLLGELPDDLLEKMNAAPLPPEKMLREYGYSLVLSPGFSLQETSRRLEEVRSRFPSMPAITMDGVAPDILMRSSAPHWLLLRQKSLSPYAGVSPFSGHEDVYAADFLLAAAIHRCLLEAPLREECLARCADTAYPGPLFVHALPNFIRFSQQACRDWWAPRISALRTVA